jgi:hypothetical protein
MLDIYNDNWVVEEPITEDGMKRLILSILEEVGMHYTRISWKEEPYARMYPHIARSGKGEITAYERLEVNACYGFKRISIKELLAAAEYTISKK